MIPTTIAFIAFLTTYLRFGILFSVILYVLLIQGSNQVLEPVSGEYESRIPGFKAWLWRVDHSGRPFDPEKMWWAFPLNDPQWRPSSSASHMKKQDFIVGIYMDGRAWALPWWVLKNHHVANLILKDIPVLLTFCEVCSSAVAFDARHNGKRYTFRLAGRYNGSILIADYETGSYWNPFEGKALAGKLKGAKLKALPANQCTWSEWIDLHNDSLVDYSPSYLRNGHGSQNYPGANNHGSPRFIRTLLSPMDQRLPDNALILGISIGGTGNAYPLETLDTIGTILQQDVSNESIVIFHKPKTLFTGTFSRKLRDEVMSFEVTGEGKIVDTQTRSNWNLHGEAVGGPLKGSKLDFIPSRVEEWYIWAANYPNTKIFSNVSLHLLPG